MANKDPTHLSLDRETFIIVMVVCCGIIATLSFVMFGPSSLSGSSQVAIKGAGKVAGRTTSPQMKVSLKNIPLSTGDEPIDTLFVQSGCAACHTIPGIDAAKGREGPRLVLGTNGPKRLIDSNYRGTATTVREYIMESILTPGVYVVPGYPDRVMPPWYGKKLNAVALDRITTYLQTLTE